MKIFEDNCNVSRETLQKLMEYEKILLAWNKKINLISNSTGNNIWVRHFLDSAQLRSFLNNFENSIIDIGSGAGFPGLVLSIIGFKNVSLVEKNFKKCTFLNYVVSNLGLDTIVINDNIENIKLDVDVIVSRAFADVKKIMYSTKNMNYKKILLLKSKNVISEFDDIDKTSYKIYNGADLTNSVIVEIAK